MTMAPEAASIVMGPAAFTTPSNIVTSPQPTTFTVAFDTDQLCLCQIAVTQVDPPPMPGTAPVFSTVVDAAPTYHHVLVYTPTTPSFMYGIVIELAPADTSGLFMRQYVTQFRADYVRISNPARSVPVRFYKFGGTPPPGPGGSLGPGAGPNIGNWNTYSWAQYNPSGRPYPQ